MFNKVNNQRPKIFNNTLYFVLFKMLLKPLCNFKPLQIKIWLVLFLLTPLTGIAQSVVFKNYTTEDGLPSSQVYDIIQDDYGYLWFSTDKGLCRYNGEKFKTFNRIDGLVNNVVFDFHKRPNGDIWCTTNSGELFKISDQEPVFTSYRYNDSLVKYVGNSVTQCVLFQKGQISISYSRLSGFLTIDEGGRVLRVPKTISGDTAPLTINLIHQLADEPFFYTDFQESFAKSMSSEKVYTHSSDEFFDKGEALNFGKGQLYCYKDNLEWVYPDTVIKKKGSEEVISTGLLDKMSYWVGYRYGGVEIYSNSEKRIAHFLKGKSVTQLFKDHEGSLWISTLEHGVFKVSDRELFYVKETKGLKISALENDESGNLFFGYDDGRIDRRLSNSTIEHIYSPASGQYLVKILNNNGTTYFSSDKLFSWSSSTGQVSTLIEKMSRYLEVLNDSIIWGMHHTHIGRDRIKGKYIFEQKRLKDVAVFNGGIYGGNIHGLCYRKYPSSNSSRQIIKGIRIDDLNVFDNQLVLGTNGNGVIILDTKHQQRYHFTKENGLNSNFVSSSYSENDSTLWVSSNNGLNRIQFHENGQFTIQGITTSDGLLSNEVWSIRVQNDTAWVGTQKGVNFFPLSILDRTQNNSKNYFLQWNGIYVNNSKKKLDENCFKYDQNEFSFIFLAISYQDELMYRYKLKGLHSAWRYTKNTELIFSALSPNQYELIIQVKGNNQEWSTEKLNYSFTILPPFWKTWWFIILIVLVIGLLIYSFFKIRILTYNKDIVRDILKYILRKIRKDLPTITIKHNGKEIRLYSHEIHYIKTDRNYLELYTSTKKYVVRLSINDFYQQLTDKIEFVQVHRSYVVRTEHIQQKGKKELIVLNTEIPIGRKYQGKLDQIHF